MTRTKGLVSFGRLAAVLIGITVALSGCNKVTGGGWMAGVNGGRATFGFQAQCQDGTEPDGEPSQNFYEGQFQYRDNAAYVGFHGDINVSFVTSGVYGNGILIESCADWGNSGNTNAEFTGTCVSHPGGVPGTFKVEVVDNGKPGPDSADEITVTTPNTDPFFGEEAGVPCTDNGQPYSNSGMLGGGNIAMPGPKNKK